jgi:hypothetical protein
MLDPSAALRELLFGRREETLLLSISIFETTLHKPSLAARLGRKRSAAAYGMRTVDFCGREREVRIALEGVPVPVNVHSDTPTSSRFGEFAKAMFDFADFRAVDLGSA